uniref:Uncharacterized protein n=1 Tax=Anguilla anguilla TaxID=7936 RepID=A0A0E9XBQ6_ANGAN
MPHVNCLICIGSIYYVSQQRLSQG